LVERNGWSWLSTGELFRKSEDPEIMERLATGELIGDDLTNEVLSEALDGDPDTPHIVLDGYPRNPAQAEWLQEHLPHHGREIAAVIVFDVPEEELVRRLSGRGRAEDDPKIVRRRLEIYAKQTQPVLDYYEKRGVAVVHVDGDGDVNDVHERIQAAAEAQNLTSQ
jgi:adenylate kinase